MPTPKKSPELHALMGTKSQALIPEEPSFAAGRPKMPSDLPPLAVAEWARLCPKLNKRKTLTKADASALEIYCRIYSRWRKVESLAKESAARNYFLDGRRRRHAHSDGRVRRVEDRRKTRGSTPRLPDAVQRDACEPVPDEAAEGAADRRAATDTRRDRATARAGNRS